MTPQERFDYKQKWLKGAFQIMAPHDLKYKYHDWCSTHLDQHKYEYKAHTGPYYDTWLFEDAPDALRFSKLVVTGEI